MPAPGVHGSRQPAHPWGIRRHSVGMTWHAAYAQLGVRIASRAQLLAVGATGRGLTAAVRGGHLVRARRDHYCLPGTEAAIIQAVRVGGVIGCVSALAARGVFVLDASFTHAHLDREASRCRSPRDRRVPLNSRERDGVELHWSPLLEPASDWSVGIADALAQAARCQHPWHAVASIDSALFLKFITPADLDRIFSILPARLQSLRDCVDGRAEAGQESVLRMILREAGLRYEVQPTFPGIGRVDLLVEGRLVLEADSRTAHDGWAPHVRDRDRDLALARLGLMSLRPVYQRTMFGPEGVRDAVLHLLAADSRFRARL